MASGASARTGPGAPPRRSDRTSLKRAAALLTAGSLEGAEASLALVLGRTPQSADALHLLGLIRSEQGRYADAIDLIRTALSIRPDAASFHHNLAGTYRHCGDRERASHHFREAIRLKPDHGAAYQGLVEVGDLDAPEELLERIESLLAAGGMADGERTFLHFAAGKLCDALGDPDRAFPHFERGNCLAGKRFDLARYEHFVRAVVFVYGASHLARRRGWGNPSKVPIFVVGMPRSGTSLVEQILASHSRVVGAGELPDLGSIAAQLPAAIGSPLPFPDCMPGAPPEALRGMARSYLNRLQSLAGGDGFCRVVDKHPLNFRYLGLIAELLPKARIVHVRRDARDTCLSCYFQNFTRHQEQSFDLETLGAFYRLYERLMEHWRQVLPLPLLEVEYEELVLDQEAVSRRLVDFCGLAWEESCLEFEKTERPVRTASTWQVRQPIYPSSVGRWRAYARFLGPLLRTLGDSAPRGASAPTT